MSATAVDDHKSGGCSVQTLQSPMLAAKRGESRTSISLSQATSPEARKVLLSANQEKAEEAKAAGKSGQSDSDHRTPHKLHLNKQVSTPSHSLC